jgi:hypothetical protein
MHLFLEFQTTKNHKTERIEQKLYTIQNNYNIAPNLLYAIKSMYDKTALQSSRNLKSTWKISMEVKYMNSVTDVPPVCIQSARGMENCDKAG